MNKYLLSLCFLFFACTVMGQKKPTQIRLVSSKNFIGSKVNGTELLKVYKATFQQDASILTSDSAYFHPQQNAFEAFGHVVITQGDTLHIYGDKLNYDGNTKTAIMTDHVKLVDKDATLTTNYFTYNTGTRIGTYTGGGKLINQDNTLTSKNGYYFASSRDAYFRYDVVMNTVDAIIKTDTLRYNSGTGISYFYGPTHIYGKKDNDVLYTENGTYDTKSEQAFFGKNNLYTQGTKSLKGDSLFYDRLTGYGKAIKHITFTDTEQKVTIRGDKAESTKADQRTVVTENAFVVLEMVDSAKTAKKDTSAAIPQKNKPGQQVKGPPPHTIPYTGNIKNIAKDTAKAADTLKLVGLKKDTAKVKRDSIFFVADTIETQIITYKDLKNLQLLRKLAGLRDTSIKATPSIVWTKQPKVLTVDPPRIMVDSVSYLHRNYFPKPAPDTTHHEVKPSDKPTGKPAKGNVNVKPGTKKLSLPNKITRIDSINLEHEIKLSDTARVRVLVGYHKAKLFKSDLQARADSIFYSYSDSTARMYVKPMVWSNNSQLSGDTIHLQFRNKKVDNVALWPHAFVVNIEKGDSTHFNQVGGKKMRGFFLDGKISKIFVNGNAETVYYERDSLKKATDIQRSISSKIRVDFAKGELAALNWFVKPEIRYVPIGIAKEEDRILKGFIWKPKDRPVSKESVIPAPYLEKPVMKTNKAETKKPSVKKPAAKAKAKTPASKTAKPATQPDIKIKTDSAKVKPDTLKKKDITPVLKPSK